MNTSDAVPLSLVASSYAARRPYYAALLALTLASAAVEVSLFTAFKKRFARTKARKNAVVVVYGVGVAAYAAALLVPVVVGIDRVPCALTRFLTLSYVPVMGAAAFVRNAIFVFTTRLNRSVFLYGRVLPDDEALEDAPADPSSSGGARGGAVHGGSAAGAGTAVLLRRWCRSLAAFAASMRYSVFTVLRPHAEVRRSDAKPTRGLAAVAVLILTPLLAANAAIAATDPFPFPNTSELPCTGLSAWEMPVILVVEAAPFIVVGVVLSARTRGLPDPWNVFDESRRTVTAQIVALLGMLLTAYLPFSPADVADAQIMMAVSYSGALAVMTLVPLWRGFQTETGQVRANADMLAGFRRNNDKAYSAYGASSVGSSNAASRVAPDAAAAGASAAIASDNNPVADLHGVPLLTVILSDARMTEAFKRHLESEWGSEVRGRARAPRARRPN